MRVELDLSKLIRYEINADEYIFLLLRVLGKKVPEIIEKSVSLESLQEREFIKIVEGGFSKRTKLSQMFSAVLETANVEDWIDEWRNLWPVGEKSGGKPVRGSRMDCLKKMKLFLARTGYTKEQVFAAAQAYVLERKHHRYQYMTLANYFIQKDNDSPLEAWCELISQDTERQQSFGEFHKEV